MLSLNLRLGVAEREWINEQTPQQGNQWTKKTTVFGEVYLQFCNKQPGMICGSAGKETKESGWSAPSSGRTRNGRTISTEITLYLHIQLCTAHCTWQEWLQFSQTVTLTSWITTEKVIIVIKPLSENPGVLTYVISHRQGSPEDFLLSTDGWN